MLGLEVDKVTELLTRVPRDPHFLRVLIYLEAKHFYIFYLSLDNTESQTDISPACFAHGMYKAVHYFTIFGAHYKDCSHHIIPSRGQ